MTGPRLKILIAGGHIRHTWSQNYLITKAIRQLGHEPIFVDTLSYRAFDKGGNLDRLFRSTHTYSVIPGFLWRKWINRKIKNLANTYSADLLLILRGDHVEPDTIEFTKKEIGAKAVFWQMEDPSQWHTVSKRLAPTADYVFTASPERVSAYQQIGIRNVRFMAEACDPDVQKPLALSPEEREYFGSNVSYIGTFDRRRLDLLSIAAEFGLKVWGAGWESLDNKKSLYRSCMGKIRDGNKAYSASRIGINVQRTLRHTTCRIFEVTACGAMLITQKALGLDSVFAPQSECVPFEDGKELRDSLAYFLDDDESRLAVAKRGYERVRRDHTYVKRIQEILSSVGMNYGGTL